MVKGPVKAVLATSDDPMSQLRQLAKTFDLNLDMGFSRCIECNAALSLVDNRSVVERVPPFVFRTQDRFHECPVCNRLNWRGTHWRNMWRELGTLMKGS